MAILSDANLDPLKNIEDTDRGIDASISELVVAIRCLIASVAHVQSWTPA